MKTIVVLSLCMLVAAISAQLPDRRGVGGFGRTGGMDGFGGIGGIDGIGGIGGPSGVSSGLLSQYCPTSFCFKRTCRRGSGTYYHGHWCYCRCGRY